MELIAIEEFPMEKFNTISITGPEIRSIFLGNCSATTFWRIRKRYTSFPKPIKIGGLVIWNKEEVTTWYINQKAGAENEGA